jgi:diguanylate cyclase (GGDEF)-like protein
MREATLLIVDDDPMILKLIRPMLGDCKFRALDASNGRDAIKLIESEVVDVVLLDVILPDIDGKDVCREIRRHYEKTPIQIVFMSGLVNADRMDTLLEAGADDFIQKPFDALELQLRLKAALMRLEKQQQLFDEREFYRQAVRNEENLSSRILDEHLNLQKMFGTIASQKVRLESTNRKLERVAKFDAITGLLNRHSLFARIDIEIEKSVREGSLLSGILIDIDGFKSVNDTYGHVVGDRILQEVGRCFKRNLRKDDVAGRYGGEEFFMILPGTNVEQGAVIAERFRHALEESSIEVGGSMLAVTASLGVAQLREAELAASWIERADKAMYQAKEQGKNCICISP